MALPEGVHVLALVVVCIIGVGVLLHIVGLATPEWSAYHANGLDFSYGLWKRCGPNKGGSEVCEEYVFGSDDDELQSSIKACEAFAILGMLASVLGLAMAAISVLFPMMGKPRNTMFPVISLAGSVASFICILIAIIVWGAIAHAKYVNNMDIGYSFILSIIGGILIVIGGGLVHKGNKSVS